MSSTKKIAISWIASATICLTGYYYARLWAEDQKTEAMKIRNQLNEEFGILLSRAGSKQE